MNENIASLLGFTVLVSALTVASWVKARRLEREAYYRSEAVKKVAEMQGNVSDSVLRLLRAALEPPVQPPSTLDPQAAQAYYRNETLKKLAEMGGEAESIVQFLREQERSARRRQREGIKLASLITSASGVGMAIFLWMIVPDRPLYAVGLIPLLVGVALAIAYLLSPKE